MEDLVFELYVIDLGHGKKMVLPEEDQIAAAERLFDLTEKEARNNHPEGSKELSDSLALLTNERAKANSLREESLKHKDSANLEVYTCSQPTYGQYEDAIAFAQSFDPDNGARVVNDRAIARYLLKKCLKNYEGGADNLHPVVGSELADRLKDTLETDKNRVFFLRPG